MCPVTQEYVPVMPTKVSVDHPYFEKVYLIKMYLIKQENFSQSSLYHFELFELFLIYHFMRYYVIFKPLEPIYNKLKAENVQLLETIHLVLLSTNRLQVIGIVHSEMKILSLITHPHVVPNLQDIRSSSQHKFRCF